MVEWEVKLLDRARDAIRMRHYSRRTEDAFLHFEWRPRGRFTVIRQ